MISVYYNCWPHTTEAGITWCFFHILLGAESGSYREGKKAIKNLLKQIFLPRGESLLITKQIGRDDKWLYISILFSFLLFFSLCIFYFEKGSWKAACPLCQSVFLQLQAAGGSSGCQSCEALTLSSLDSGKWFTILAEQFLKAVSEALFSSCLNKCNIN